MKTVTLEHQYDPDLKVTIAPPSGALFEEAFAEWYNGTAAGREWHAKYELFRACSSVRGEAFVSLTRQWSGVVDAAWTPIQIMANAHASTRTFYDARELLDGSEPSEAILAELATAGIAKAQLLEWLRVYPRKGPAGKGQLIIARFGWGWYVCRSAEPSEWFTADPLRSSGKHYEAFRLFVQSCTLFPDVSSILERNREAPGLALTLGGIAREAAGEELARIVGESFGA
jgi:hypothetical protein